MAFWSNPSDSTPKQSHRWIISFGSKDKQTSENYLPFYFAKSVDRPSYSIKTVQAKYLYSHTFNFPTRTVWNPITISFYDVLINAANSKYLYLPTVESYESYIKNGKILQRIGVESADGLALSESRVINFKQSTQAFFYKFLQFSGYFDPEEYGQDAELLAFKSYNFKKSMINSLVGQDLSTKETRQIADLSQESKLGELTLQEIDPDGNIVETWLIANPLISDVKFDRFDYTADGVLSITATINYDWARLIIPEVPSNETEQIVFNNLEQRQASEYALTTTKENADTVLKIAEQNLSASSDTTNRGITESADLADKATQLKGVAESIVADQGFDPNAPFTGTAGAGAFTAPAAEPILKTGQELAQASFKAPEKPSEINIQERQSVASEPPVRLPDPPDATPEDKKDLDDLYNIQMARYLESRGESEPTPLQTQNIPETSVVSTISTPQLQPINTPETPAQEAKVVAEQSTTLSNALPKIQSAPVPEKINAPSTESENRVSKMLNERITSVTQIDNSTVQVNVELPKYIKTDSLARDQLRLILENYVNVNYGKRYFTIPLEKKVSDRQWETKIRFITEEG